MPTLYVYTPAWLEAALLIVREQRRFAAYPLVRPGMKNMRDCPLCGTRHRHAAGYHKVRRA